MYTNTIQSKQKRKQEKGMDPSVPSPFQSFLPLKFAPFSHQFPRLPLCNPFPISTFFPRILPISHSLFFHSPCFVHWLQCCNLLGWHRQLQLLCRIFLTDSLLILFRVQCFPFCVSFSLDMFYAIFSRAEGGLWNIKSSDNSWENAG